MSARFLDDPARQAFERAIAAIEAASAVEVVIAVRRQSAGHRHANVLIGALVAIAGLAAMLFSAHPFGLVAILVDPVVAGLATGGLVELLPGLKRVLTPVAQRRRAVLRAARATFVERRVHATLGRSGLLVYISWLEAQVAFVPDIGVERAVTPAVLAHAEAAMTAAMRSGGVAVARALDDLRGSLATALPRHHDDLNELSDAIDSDLARSRR